MAVLSATDLRGEVTRDEFFLRRAVDSRAHLATNAYAGVWQAMAKAGETADWQSPEVATYATGDALGVINRSLYSDRLNRVVSKGGAGVNSESHRREAELRGSRLVARASLAERRAAAPDAELAAAETFRPVAHGVENHDWRRSA